MVEIKSFFKSKFASVKSELQSSEGYICIHGGVDM